MSDPCCAETSVDPRSRACPVSKSRGQPVRWITVAALSVGPVPPRQKVWLCLDAGCEVVYFGDRGLELWRDGVHTVPAGKLGEEGLACYCFGHSRRAIEGEVRELGRSPTLESIRTRVQEKNCACEVRNPTGRCCVPEIERMVAGASKKGVA